MYYPEAELRSAVLYEPEVMLAVLFRGWPYYLKTEGRMAVKSRG
jgi:hypothetical protein